MNYQVYSGEIEITYAFVESQYATTDLVIVFPGARFRGDSPSAEFLLQINTYKKVHALFYIDKIAEHSTAFYVMKAGDNVIERTFMSLVMEKVEQFNIKRIIFVGQSAGGKAAIYYGLKYDAFIIAGSPSYLLNFDDLDNKTSLSNIRTIESTKYAVSSFTRENVEEYSRIVEKTIQTSKYTKKCFILGGKFEGEYVQHRNNILNEFAKYNIEHELILGNFQSHADIYPFMARNLLEILDYIIEGDFLYGSLTRKKLFNQMCSLNEFHAIHFTTLGMMDDKLKYRLLFRVRINNNYGKLLKINFFKFENFGEVGIACCFGTSRMRINKIEGKMPIGILHYFSNCNSNQREKWGEFWIEAAPEIYFRGSVSIEYSSAFLSRDDFQVLDRTTDNMHDSEGDTYKEESESIFIDGNVQMPLTMEATESSPGVMSIEDKRKLNEMYDWFLKQKQSF